MSIDTTNNDSKRQVEEFQKFIALAEDKTVITLLSKLLDKDLLEFITEYPSVQYTKEMVKLTTYVKTYMQTYNIYPNEEGIYDNDEMQIIEEMCTQFMKKMTSHKRRRSHEIVNGASRQDANSAVNVSEHKGLKRFLGIK